MNDRPLEEWSNEEIRVSLLAHGEGNLPVTPTTRSLLMRKLRGLVGKAHTSREGNGTSTTPQPAQDGDNQTDSTTAGANLTENTTAGANQTENTTAGANQTENPTASAIANESVIEGYYGVSARCDDPGSLHLSPFYTSNAEVLNIIKKHPGVRFNLKKFETRESAEAFSQREPETISEHRPSTTICEPKTNNFPSLKTQDLTKLRKLIESHEVAAFRDAIWTNPRYLISSGDAPTILHVSFCYNALHCAVRGGKVEMCHALFAILQSERFWEMVYPDDSVETRVERRRHLIDLYLNMQDSRVPRPGKEIPVQNNETPLHFACKFGYEEIVSFLVSFPQTCTEVKNSFGETPADVVCRNATHSSPRLRKRIQELLKGSSEQFLLSIKASTARMSLYTNLLKGVYQLRVLVPLSFLTPIAPEVYYIPVLRAVDNSTPPQLGSPCTSEGYTQQQERTVVGSPLTPIVGQAFAGPMSPSKVSKSIYKTTGM